MNDDELDIQLKELFQTDVLTIDPEGEGADALFDAIIEESAMTTVISAAPAASATEVEDDDVILIDFRRPEAAPQRGRLLVAAAVIVIALLSLGLIGLVQSGDSPVSSNDGTIEETPTDVNEDGTDENSSAFIGTPSEFLFVRGETEVVSVVDGVETVVWSIDTAIAAGTADSSDSIESLELLAVDEIGVNLCCNAAQTWLVELDTGTSSQVNRPDAGTLQSPALELPDGRSVVTIPDIQALLLNRPDGLIEANRTLRDVEVLAFDDVSNVVVALKTQGGANDDSILVLLSPEDLSTVGQIDLDGHFDDIDIADGFYLLTRDDGEVQIISDSGAGEVSVLIEGAGSEALWLDSTPAGLTFGSGPAGSSPQEIRSAAVADATALFADGIGREELDASSGGLLHPRGEISERIDTLFNDFGWLENDLTVEVNIFTPFDSVGIFFGFATVWPEGEPELALAFQLGAGPDGVNPLRIPTIEDRELNVVAATDDSITVDTIGSEGGVGAFLNGQQLETSVDEADSTTTIVLPDGFDSGEVLTIVTSTTGLPTVAVVIGE